LSLLHRNWVGDAEIDDFNNMIQAAMGEAGGGRKTLVKKSFKGFLRP
jgi:hypothetical protein